MIRISNLFEVSFDTNEIILMTDKDRPSKTKVEPRIMQVLEILIKNSPHVVSREQLIAEVWDNYGGADDALNQAISHLRKMLSDKDKENRIIETVIKKGYRFAGTIEHIPLEQKDAKIRQQRSRILIAFAIAIIFCIAFIAYRSSIKKSSSGTNNTLAPEAPALDGKTPEADDAFAPDVDQTQ